MGAAMGAITRSTAEDLNAKRARILRAREGAQRKEQLAAEIAGQTCRTFAQAWTEGWHAAKNGIDGYANPYERRADR